MSFRILVINPVPTLSTWGAALLALLTGVAWVGLRLHGANMRFADPHLNVRTPA